MFTVEENPIQSFKETMKPWLICFAATLFFFYEFIQGNMFASIAQNVMHDFQVDANKMALLSSVYYLSNVIFLFIAGMILDRCSIKKTILFAMFLCVLSTFIISSSESFYVAMFCRFITGIGSAFCFLGPVRLASQWFPPQRMALVSGAIVTMAMTGGMLAQYPLTMLINHVGWRAAVGDIGFLGIAILVIMAFGISEKRQSHSKPSFAKGPILSAAKQVYFNSQYLRAAFYTSLMNMAIAVFGAMMGTLYLKQRLGIEADQASLINSMLFLGTIFGGPMIGNFSDKIGKRIMPMKVSALISLITMLAILYLPVSYHVMMVLFFLLGFFTAGQIISYALVAESCKPEMTATAVSIISIFTQGGFFVYQNLFSQLLTFHGELTYVNGAPVYSLAAYQTAAVILPIGLILAMITVVGLKETFKKDTHA